MSDVSGPTVRLLLADVDGTLVTPGKVLTARAIAAVRELKVEGVLFAVTSGRPPRGMAMLIEPLALELPLPAFNGGLLVDRHLVVLEQHEIRRRSVLPVIELLESHGLDAWLYRGADWYVRRLAGPHVDQEARTVEFTPTVVDGYDNLTDAVAKLVGLSWHRVHAICSRYVDLALADADLSGVRAVAIDETSCRRGHDYLTIAADAEQRKVVFVTEGKDAETVAAFADYLTAHKATPEQVKSVSIDMSPAFIKGVALSLPNARVTFDKFHVVAHASAAVDQMRRLEQRTDPSLKGLRWTLLKDRDRLSDEGRADLDALIAQAATKRTARAWLYREHLREILDRKQINVVSAMLKQWCTNVLRSKVKPMREVARMIREHFDGIVAWTQTRQTNGFIEALNGLFQAAKRKARGYTRFTTMRTVLFLIAGKLDFTNINPHAA